MMQQVELEQAVDSPGGGTGLSLPGLGIIGSSLVAIVYGAAKALEGWRGDKVQTLETEGEMIQRVMGDLMGQKNIVVLNDEAHHCYRERVKDAVGETEDDLKGDEKSEAKENNEAARMWISGLEAVKR